MKIDTFIVGPIETNCYIVHDEDSKKGIIIDAGEEPDRILKFLKDKNIDVQFIVSTHGHFDHVNGVPKLKSALNIPFLIHEDDAHLLSAHASDIMRSLGYDTVSVEVDRLLKDSDEIKFGNLSFKVLHTPGHTQGCICLYFDNEKTLFSGDTLFKGDVGRTDLPGSSTASIIKSLMTKIFPLDPSTMVYPGHGEKTKVGDEKGMISALGNSSESRGAINI